MCASPVCNHLLYLCDALAKLVCLTPLDCRSPRLSAALTGKVSEASIRPADHLWAILEAVVRESRSQWSHRAPWTPEEVSPGAERAQLFHASFFGASILEPDLLRGEREKEMNKRVA